MVYLVVSVKSWLTKEPNTKRPNVLYISLLSRATLNIKTVIKPSLSFTVDTGQSKVVLSSLR